MGDVKIPNWLKKLPLAPEFHPTDCEFADPIAYISKIEKEASAFGICKVIPPLPKPSKKYVFSNLKRSLLKSPELGPSPSASLSDQLGCRDEGNGEAQAVFTTRHQELGSSSRKTKGLGSVWQTTAHKQVWQSGEVYTLEQFESKSKVFARNHLGAVKEVTPLVVEALFWKAASEKPIYIEYANDVPGSGFGEPQDIGQYFHKRRRRKLNEKGQAGCEHETYETGVVSNSYNDAERGASVKNDSDPSLVSSEISSSQRQKVPNADKVREGTSGLKLSNCPWNLQVIARSPGSLTRFMVDDIPGVTSPMIYIGMLFSWFAWHVEDHELHSLNYLHTGSPKTWYAVPGNYAFTFEEAIRAQGYGGNLDRLAALTLLGEKTNLLSPEVVVASGIPCCRLVQNPGEFVVTFPRAYHVGFSHGFNCGEAANFGSPQWLKVAKEAAVRRAAMNYLPMLSHQQLLYLLTMSFVSSVPRALLQGGRTSRLKDRQKGERELLVKKAFIEDMLNENNLLWDLLGKESTYCAVLWDPDLLPMPSNVSRSVQMCANPNKSGLVVGQRDAAIHITENEIHADVVHDETSNISNISNGKHFVDRLNADVCNSSPSDSPKLHVVNSEGFSVYDDDLPCGLHVDSGTLPCVACGILGFPFMAIVQPSQKASVGFFPAECQMIHEGLGVLRSGKHHTPLARDQKEINFFSDGQHDYNCGKHECISEASNCERDVRSTENCLEKSFTCTVASSSQGTQNMGLKDTFSSLHQIRTSPCVELNHAADAKYSGASKGLEPCSSSKVYEKWNTSSRFFRPKVFCLEHALETEELLRARGGANMLIICHSAYPKIKAHAAAVAEEIAVPYTCNEVPLENASKEELNLINVSICDELQECREDWTSKLGLNLSYCVKLRKLSEAKQEPALPLGGLFSEAISGCNLSKLGISSLKWNSRRTRSHKATVWNESIPCQSSQIKGDIPMEKQERSKVAGENKVIIQYSRRKCNKYKTAQNFPSNQQPEAESRRNGLPDNNVVSRDTLCSIDNIGIVSSQLGKCPHLNGKKQHEECISKESEMSEVSCPAKSLIHEDKGNDSARVVRSSNAYHSGVQQEHYTIEETRKDLSDPVNSDSSLIIENAGNDSDKLMTSVENLEILHEALTTGETMEVCKVSDRANAEDLLDNERTGNYAVELIGERQENNMCMMDETGMVGEVFDHAKSAVLHAIYNLVVQDLETQIRSQTFEDLEVEYSPLQHKMRNADGEVSNSSDPAETIGSPDVASSFVNNNGEQEMESIEVCKGGKVSSSLLGGMSPESAHTKRGQNKRKREIEQLTVKDVGTNGFIRSPCEGLRPRTSRNTACVTGSDDGTKVETACKKAKRSPNGSIFSKEKKVKETNRVHGCDLEGCQMIFETKDELNLHQSDRCTQEGCKKQFSSHKYTMSHQKVHIDERPLKCKWKGCKMSFKWPWARTEHMRVHTGERPYKCETEGCGLSFRFVSDSSRHRRKTGHRVSHSR